jgi:hypothetical protein
MGRGGLNDAHLEAEIYDTDEELMDDTPLMDESGIPRLSSNSSSLSLRPAVSDASARSIEGARRPTAMSVMNELMQQRHHEQEEEVQTLETGPWHNSQTSLEQEEIMGNDSFLEHDGEWHKPLEDPYGQEEEDRDSQGGDMQYDQLLRQRAIREQLGGPQPKISGRGSNTSG